MECRRGLCLSTRFFSIFPHFSCLLFFVLPARDVVGLFWPSLFIVLGVFTCFFIPWCYLHVMLRLYRSSLLSSRSLVLPALDGFSLVSLCSLVLLARDASAVPVFTLILRSLVLSALDVFGLFRRSLVSSVRISTFQFVWIILLVIALVLVLVAMA